MRRIVVRHDDDDGGGGREKSNQPCSIDYVNQLMPISFRLMENSSLGVFLTGQINCLGIYCCPFGLRSLTINKSVNCVRIHNRTYLCDASSRTYNSRLMRNYPPPPTSPSISVKRETRRDGHYLYLPVTTHSCI